MLHSLTEGCKDAPLPLESAQIVDLSWRKSAPRAGDSIGGRQPPLVDGGAEGKAPEYARGMR